MQWRLRYIACKFSRKENLVIKIRLGMIKATKLG